MAFKFEKNETNLSIVEWWRTYKNKYPYLSIVARRICAVRATSSESERDFSVSGQIASKLRLRLSPATIRMCTFCSINQEFVPEHLPENTTDD